MTSLPARFWAKVEKTETCWLWTAGTNGGYGQFGGLEPGRSRYAHRLAYEDLVGPVPEGLELDHVKARGCHSRNCVNPAHLEPVTRQENVRRGRMIEVAAARQRAKTHCPHGHPYDEANTYLSRSGGRKCRACHNRRSLAAYHAKKQETL